MGINDSRHYDSVNIIDIINEYTIVLSISNYRRDEIDYNDYNDEKDEKDENGNITVRLKGISPYDLDNIHESCKSRKAIRILNKLKNKSHYSAEIYKNKKGEDECILTDTKDNIIINDWLVSRGHVRSMT